MVVDNLWLSEELVLIPDGEMVAVGGTGGRLGRHRMCRREPEVK